MFNDDDFKKMKEELDNYEIDDSAIDDIVNHDKSALINELISQSFKLIGQLLIYAVLLKVGGTLGLLSVICLGLSSLAQVFKFVSQRNANKRIEKEYEKFLDNLKNKGTYGKKD